jgi:2-polyprenyl-3-methyl-5-hydroxy-6-metoxy-1,4-benzoquinol methylase
MKQRHKYEYNVDINGPTAAAAVVRMVGTGKRVLEIGAGPGSITRCLRENSGCRVTAIEIDKDAVERLSPFCERVYQCDLNDQAWDSDLLQEGKFEVIVAADVLEHLYDPWAVLETIRNLVEKNGYIVVSLPHIGHNVVIACLLQENITYRDWGLLDKTHIRFFGIENMQQLFNNAGFKIVEAEFIVLPPEQTELVDNWRGLPGELREYLTKNRFGTVYQVVVKAKPDLSPGQGLNLLSLPVPVLGLVNPGSQPLSTRFIYSIKKMVVPHINYRTRSRLRNILHKLGVKF